MSRNHRFPMALALVLVIGVIAAPSAFGKALLMPKIGNGVATSEQPGQDSRSLPAMDAATAAAPANAQSAEETGFDWSDAGIGASSVFAVVLIAAGGMAFMQRRRGYSLRKPGAPAVTN